MTVIKPNSVAGINSITVQSGNSLAVHKANGELIRTITSNSGVSTFSSISVGTAYTDNSAAKSINIGVGASISQHDANTLSLGTNGDERARFTSTGTHIGSNGSSFDVNGDDLTITNSSHGGITIITGSSSDGVLRFGDGMSGTAQYQGYMNYKHADNALVLGTQANERLRIDSSGRVLIGTTTEGHTNGDDLTIATSGGTGMTIRSGTSDTGSIFFSDGTSGAAEYAGLVQYDHANNFMRFYAGGSEQLRVNSSGHLLLGTTTAAVTAGKALMIAATDGARIKLCDSDLGVTGSDGYEMIASNGGTAYLWNRENTDLLFGTNNTERLRIDSSGRVLIGVDASYANASIDELQIGDNSSSNQSGITIGSTDESAIAFADAGDTRAGSMTYNHAADAMIFKTNGQNEYFRVHTNGVKVNSASDAIMEMHTSNGTAHSRINFSNNNGDNTGGIWYSSSNHMQFRTASDYQFVISATNGRLERSFGAGSSTDADGMWFNNDQSATGTFVRFWQTSGSYGANQIGTISHTANNTAYNTSSDYRLKENAVAISDGITRLKTLKPYRFNFKTEPSKTVDGFFAHEAATVVPEAVTGTKDEVSTIADTSIGVAVGDPVHQGMDYGKITPLLTAALQEAIAKIEVLETKVAALEGG